MRRQTKAIIADVLTKIGKLLAYLPVESLRICLKIINFLKHDARRLTLFFTFVGIVAFSKLLVNRAARVRIDR